jgi:hypothetical protein
MIRINLLVFDVLIGLKKGSYHLIMIKNIANDHVIRDLLLRFPSYSL